MTIIVCGLGDVAATLAARRPSHMVTLLDPATMIATPGGLQAERHLKLAVNDIAEPAEGLVLPSEEVVRQLLEFGRGWDEAAPMLIHCWAGISRSTASAFVAADGGQGDGHVASTCVVVGVTEAAGDVADENFAFPGSVEFDFLDAPVLV